MSNHRDNVPEAARQLAEAFAQDRALAEQQNTAQHRLQAANGQLWPALHPDALGLYDDTHRSGSTSRWRPAVRSPR